MKEFTIIFIILIIIIGSSIYTDNYLKKSCKELVNDLQLLRKNIQENTQTNNIEKLKKEVKDVYNKWEEAEEKWAFIVLHSELDLIETSFVRMKAQIEVQELDRCIEEIDISIFLVNHISEKERFCLKNIF